MDSQNPESPVSPELSTPRRKGGMGILTVVLILLSLALVLGLGAYLRTKTPGFALTQVDRALEQRDLSAFVAWVDVPAVATQTVEAALEDASGAGGLFGAAGIAKTLMNRAKPQFVPRLEDEIRTQVFEGTFSWDKLARLQSEAQNLKLRELLGASDWTYGGRGPVTSDGKGTAHVLLTYRRPDGSEVPVRLVLAKHKPNWQIVAVEPAESDAE